MKRIAISQRVDAIENRRERRDALDQRVGIWVIAAGWIPCPVPNIPEGIAAWLEEIAPDGIILSGGNDIGRCRERDSTERSLIAYAALHSLPLLGICRGMQMLAVEAGASLRRVDGHATGPHCISGDITGEVNSFHEWALASLPEGYRELARSADGNIEAMAHQGLPWEGWMWHPERTEPFSADDLSRFHALFAGAPGARSPSRATS